jgi:F-type H+-transporting ATPase subunit b
MRGGWFLVAIAVFALLVAAPTALQAQHKDAEKVADKELAHEAKDVEHNIFRPAMDLGIWSLVVFLVLLLVLSKFAWKPLMQGLEHREKSIHAALHEAHQAREESARLRGQLEEQMRKANDQARELLDEARRAAERTTAEMTAEAHKKIQAEHERLQREMALAHDQAVRDLQTHAAQLATLVASKVIRRQLNHDDHRQLVDEALAELRQAENGRRQTAVV